MSRKYPCQGLYRLDPRNALKVIARVKSRVHPLDATSGIEGDRQDKRKKGDDSKPEDMKND